MDIHEEPNFTMKRIIVSSILTIMIGFILISYVTSLLAFVSPSQEHRWDTEVSSINKPSFSPGETVNITGLLDEKPQYMEQWKYYYYFGSAEAVRWSILVIDPYDSPIQLFTGTLSNAQGDIMLNPVTFTAPNVKGFYRIRIVVWTEYLPDGETRTNLINESSFEVV